MKGTNEPQESLQQRQEEMENHAMALGGERFRRQLEKAVSKHSEAGVGAAKRLLRDGLAKVEEALAVLVENQGGHGARSNARRWVELLGVEVAAYLSLKVVLDNIHTRVSVRRAAFQVTELILDELRYRRFRDEAPALFQYCMTGFTTSSYAHRARSLDARIHHAAVDISDLTMTQSERLTVGVKLLDVVREVTGLVVVEKSRVKARRGGGGKASNHLVELVAAPETLEWLDQKNSVLEYLWPVNLPMVMPPIPWGPGGQRGGYRFALRGKHPLVRATHHGGGAVAERAEMPAVYDAVNRIQETAWCINRRVHEVIETLMERGGGVAGLPEASDKPRPLKPHNIDTDEGVRKAWRRAAHLIHEENHQHRVARKSLFDLLNVVRKVADEDAIWFPHNVDFRGRVYPITSYLHPQGDDKTKALLQFADGKPVGKEGWRYLALHGANCMDKTPDGRKLPHMTLDERLEWVKSVELDVVRTAADPLGNMAFWLAAEEPWQFLAWCFEYAGFIREGTGFVSYLPVAMDGTCNGLQHFAALWLDPRGAKAVNVSPSERPQDIYQAVADEVLGMLEREAGKNEHAVRWLRSGLVDRTLCKRPVMTFGYGSAQFGFSEQLYEKAQELLKGTALADLFTVEEKGEENGEVKPKSCLFPACSYLAAKIWDALQVVSVSAFKGMAWMRECAKVIAKDGGKAVQWEVPGTGFPVVQRYVVQNVARANTILAGSAFKPQVYVDTNQPAWKKQTSSIAPNVIHSLDAAALMGTVNMAATSGVEHFAMVHDSYGTLAADAALLAQCTRQAFYQLYTERDVVRELHSQFHQQVPELKLPAPPRKGALDLGDVLVSPYFFS